jgi:hypothetical protein
MKPSLGVTSTGPVIPALSSHAIGTGGISCKRGRLLGQAVKLHTAAKRNKLYKKPDLFFIVNYFITTFLLSQEGYA